MSETRVVHVKDNVPGAVYIGRAMPRQGLKASIFANPYKIGGKDPSTDSYFHNRPMGRFRALHHYAEDLVGPKRYLRALLPALRGKPLACWCRHDGDTLTLDTGCHGDVIIGLLNKYTDEELRQQGGAAINGTADTHTD